MLLTIGDSIGVTKSSASNIKKVSHVIVTLAPQFIKMPSNATKITETQIRFYKMARRLRIDELADYIKKCNSDLLSNSECKPIKVFPIMKNNNIFQCILQLDRSSYDSHYGR